MRSSSDIRLRTPLADGKDYLMDGSLAPASYFYPVDIPARRIACRKGKDLPRPGQCFATANRDFVGKRPVLCRGVRYKYAGIGRLGYNKVNFACPLLFGIKAQGRRAKFKIIYYPVSLDNIALTAGKSLPRLRRQNR